MLLYFAAVLAAKASPLSERLASELGRGDSVFRQDIGDTSLKT